MLHTGRKEKEFTIVNEDVIVELATRQVGIDVEQYPYKDIKVGKMIMGGN